MQSTTLLALVVSGLLCGCATTAPSDARETVRISYLMRRLPHLSLEEFQSYWSEEHPQAAPEDAFATLGVQRYVQVLPLETDARRLVIGPRTGLVEPFDGVAEIWFASRDAIAEGASRPGGAEAAAALLEDERNFIDLENSPLWLAEEFEFVSLGE